MRVKVIKRYVDRITKEIREVGKTCDYGEERTRELISGDYVEETKAQKPESAEVKG